MRALVLVVVTLLAQAAQAELKTVPYVDVGQYLGRWFQIAHKPIFFEAGCTCSVQDLAATPAGPVSVVNTCRANSPSGVLRTISGTATSDDPTTNARFTVDFGLPHKGAYWIIALDPQYRYAVVSDPSLKSLYILSKTPTLADDLFNTAVSEAKTQVDTSDLEMTLQTGCVYP
jgi:apolipoprotein D and lipocalin family protein